MQVMVDSKVVIEWTTGIFAFHSLYLQQWGDIVLELIQNFNHITIHYIFRELNGVSNDLSKKALTIILGICHI